jgi:hypothetical protein
MKKIFLTEDSKFLSFLAELVVMNYKIFFSHDCSKKI